MGTIRFLIYDVIKILLLIFGVILIISPNKMLNYFIKKDLENLKNPNEKIYKSKSIRKTEKICKVGRVYCIGIILVDRLIRNSELMVIMVYIIIPIIGLHLLEKKFK
ncbi:hypothetical protein [Clostridium massiliodielmoense]|uniref:hypothetical protein n=1 Tax=Clostridium massiliodielmoense TaxID=1776385 RepID=UPI00016688D1|nr:hypothetical protein [Clostridium massiliodielmoense]EDS78026.1 hypothetical protein CBC_0556 [Clostridium botulinum C str. Eklund]KEH97538.1 hypothetical protein Z962_03195 [Clostridium botulinum C/D str. BKT12695]NEZ48991.1 hypothetical protein [Clostridium botulinum]